MESHAAAYCTYGLQISKFLFFQLWQLIIKITSWISAFPISVDVFWLESEIGIQTKMMDNFASFTKPIAMFLFCVWTLDEDTENFIFLSDTSKKKPKHSL